MKKIFAFIIMLSCSGYSFSQKMSSVIYGYITDKTGEELINAAVTFSPDNDSLKLYSCICDINGYFQLELPKGEYHFSVSYMGQGFKQAGYMVAAMTDSVALGKIGIDLKDNVLDEVVVKSKRPFVSYNGANSVYNLSANPAAIGGSVLDGLRLIPGLQTEEANGLSVFGFYKLTVAVNNQVLRLSNEEIRAYLSTLSVADIENVEIIRHPGPEYGKDVESVLNITTKKKPGEDINAFMSANIVYRRLISEQATGRLNINKGQWKNYIAYSFNDSRSKEELSTSLGNDTTSVKPYRAHAIQLGSELQINPNHLVGAYAQATFSDEHLETNNNTRITMKRDVVRTNAYQNITGRKWWWNNNADYTYSSSDRLYKQSISELDKMEDDTHYLRLSTDFLYRFTPTASVQVGGFYNYSKIDNRPMQEGKSSYYEYKESAISAYITLRYRSSRLNAYGGLQANYDSRDFSGTYTTDSKNNHIWKLQPYLNINYRLAANHNITANFQTYYRRPYFRDMMTYVSSSSSFLNRVGNYNLKNCTRYNLSVTYTYMNAATVEVSLSDEESPIVEVISPDGSNYLITKTNLDNSRYLRIVAGAPIPVIYNAGGLQWTTTTYLAYHMQRDKGWVNEKAYNHHFHAYYIQHKQSLSLPDQWYIDARITYFSPLTAGVYTTEKQWWTDFTITKRMGMWRFSLTGYDLFNTNIARGEVAGLDKKVNFRKEWFNPKVTLGVSLTLGNQKLKTSNKRGTGSDYRTSQTANEGISIENKE